MAEKVPKSQRVYRSLLNRNVHPFIVIFFEECFLRGAIFSKVALLRPENEHEFSRFSISCIVPKILSVMYWISQTSKIKSTRENFCSSRIFEIDPP